MCAARPTAAGCSSVSRRDGDATSTQSPERTTSSGRGSDRRDVDRGLADFGRCTADRTRRGVRTRCTGRRTYGATIPSCSCDAAAAARRLAAAGGMRGRPRVLANQRVRVPCASGPGRWPSPSTSTTRPRARARPGLKPAPTCASETCVPAGHPPANGPARLSAQLHLNPAFAGPGDDDDELATLPSRPIRLLLLDRRAAAGCHLDRTPWSAYVAGRWTAATRRGTPCSRRASSRRPRQPSIPAASTSASTSTTASPDDLTAPAPRDRRSA